MKLLARCARFANERRRTAHFTLIALLLLLVAILGDRLTREQIKREQEQKRAVALSGVADYSRSAVVTVDADTSRIVGWNDSAQRLLGWSADEAMDADLEFMMPEQLRGMHHERLTDSFIRSRLLDRSYVISGEALTKKGEIIPVRVRVWGVQEGSKYEFVAVLEKLPGGISPSLPKSRIEKPDSSPPLDDSPTIGPPTGDLRGLQ